MEEIFDSALRSAGDLAGVFEHDGETSYFYLHAGDGDAGRRVVDSIHILSGKPDVTETDVTIRWDSVEEKVGLFIKGVLQLQQHPDDAERWARLGELTLFADGAAAMCRR